MDSFERWFGVSPDGGDGSLELFWIVAIVAAVAVIVFRGRIREWLVSHQSTPPR